MKSRPQKLIPEWRQNARETSLRLAFAQQRMDRSRMGRKLGSRASPITSDVLKGVAMSGLGNGKTVATAMVAGAVVALACTTKGAVP